MECCTRRFRKLNLKNGIIWEERKVTRHQELLRYQRSNRSDLKSCDVTTEIEQRVALTAWFISVENGTIANLSFWWSELRKRGTAGVRLLNRLDSLNTTRHNSSPENASQKSEPQKDLRRSFSGCPVAGDKAVTQTQQTGHMYHVTYRIPVIVKSDLKIGFK